MSHRGWLGPEDVVVSQTELWPVPDRSFLWLLAWAALVVVALALSAAEASEAALARWSAETAVLSAARVSGFFEVQTPAHFWAWLRQWSDDLAITRFGLPASGARVFDRAQRPFFAATGAGVPLGAADTLANASRTAKNATATGRGDHSSPLAGGEGVRVFLQVGCPHTTFAAPCGEPSNQAERLVLSAWRASGAQASRLETCTGETLSLGVLRGDAGAPGRCFTPLPLASGEQGGSGPASATEGEGWVLEPHRDRIRSDFTMSECAAACRARAECVGVVSLQGPRSLLTGVWREQQLAAVFLPGTGSGARGRNASGLDPWVSAAYLAKGDPDEEQRAAGATPAAPASLAAPAPCLLATATANHSCAAAPYVPGRVAAPQVARPAPPRPAPDRAPRRGTAAQDGTACEAHIGAVALAAGDCVAAAAEAAAHCARAEPETRSLPGEAPAAGPAAGAWRFAPALGGGGWGGALWHPAPAPWVAPGDTSVTRAGAGAHEGPRWSAGAWEGLGAAGALPGAGGSFGWSLLGGGDQGAGVDAARRGGFLSRGAAVVGLEVWLGFRGLMVVAPPPPPPRTKWTRRVPHPVLSGHAASLTPY